MQSVPLLGISRSSRYKRSATGAQRAHYRKKRKFELGRQAALTKLGPKRVHSVRVRGGNLKHRALRLDSGNFAWGSEHTTRKTRLIGVVRARFVLKVISDLTGSCHVGIQCIEQRVGANKYSGKECYRPGRCHSVQAVV